MAKGKALRWRYEKDFKRRIVAEENASDVSISALARRPGLSASFILTGIRSLVVICSLQLQHRSWCR